MNQIFWICVEIMKKGSHAVGLTYQELNVLLFVILHPALTIFLWWRMLKYRKKYQELLKKSAD
ncbi:MAG: hypothetical protein ACOVOL_06935 [Bacteroidia bacterium]|jgi:hypothetical protein